MSVQIVLWTVLCSALFTAAIVCLAGRKELQVAGVLLLVAGALAFGQLSQQYRDEQTGDRNRAMMFIK